jgi:hypothetical protein
LDLPLKDYFDCFLFESFPSVFFLGAYFARFSLSCCFFSLFYSLSFSFSSFLLFNSSSLTAFLASFVFDFYSILACLCSSLCFTRVSCYYLFFLLFSSARFLLSSNCSSLFFYLLSCLFFSNYSCRLFLFMSYISIIFSFSC